MAGSHQRADARPPATHATSAPHRLVPDREPDFRDRLIIVYKHRRVAVSVFLMVVLGALLRTYATTPLYQATARLMIEMDDDRTEHAMAMGGAIGVSSYYWQDPKLFYETQYRILVGQEVAGRVAKRVDLSRVAEFDDARTSPNSESMVNAELLARVAVHPVQNSRLVDVTFVSADPAFAALAANTFADEYVQQNFEVRRRTVATSLEWLSRELANQQRKVEASERAMAQYREDQNALSLEQRQNIVVARLNQLNDAVTKAKTNRAEKEALYEQIKGLDEGASVETIPAILQNPFIQTIKTRLADLEGEKAMLLERYGEKYPDVMKVNASLQDASRQLQQELAKAIEAIRNAYQSAVAEEQTLERALDAQKGKALDLDRKSVSYTVLERDAHSNRQVYEALLLREKELQVMANSRGSNVRVTDPAAKPSVPFTPMPRHDVMLAIVVGLFLSLGLVFFLNRLDDTVKNPDDVSDDLKIPLLGLTPKVSGSGQLLLSQQVPHEFGEAFRSLRTALIFDRGTEPTRLVMVTSAQPLEGKTTTACNLALALAMGGARVLLIDADMRRPGVNHMLPIATGGAGLADVLTGRAPTDAAVVALGSLKVWVMAAGSSPPNPSELLGSWQMRALLEDAKRGPYDWVIVDTPPVLAVTDAVVLAPLVDSIAFVIGSESTRRPHAVRALDTLMNSSTGQISGVLNRVDLKRNKYYYARHYGYTHSGSHGTSTSEA